MNVAWTMAYGIMSALMLVILMRAQASKERIESCSFFLSTWIAGCVAQMIYGFHFAVMVMWFGHLIGFGIFFPLFVKLRQNWTLLIFVSYIISLGIDFIIFYSFSAGHGILPQDTKSIFEKSQNVLFAIRHGVVSYVLLNHVWSLFSSPRARTHSAKMGAQSRGRE